MLSYTEAISNVFIVKEPTDRVNTLNSIIIKESTEFEAVLIDANYPFRHIDELYTRIKSPAKALIFSHCHLDHTAHGFYHQEKFGTPLYCPVQEKDHLLSLEKLMEDVGFKRLSNQDTYVMMARQYMKFKEAKEIIPFTPGIDSFSFNSASIQSIHIPGHSPGHTAFIIESSTQTDARKVLYVSDIGSHPYYGDDYCDLKQYYQSLDKLEQLYFSENFILIPAHGTVYLDKNPDFFQKIRDRIEKNGQSVRSALSKNIPKTIKQLVQEGVITPKRRQEPLIKELYYLWDGGMINQHLREFIERGIAENVDNKEFLTDRYILS